MKFLKGLTLVSSLFVLLVSSGCRFFGSWSDRVDHFVDSLNGENGYERFVLVKSNTERRRHIVLWDGEIGEYVAFDLSGFYVGSSLDYYFRTHDNDGDEGADIIYGLNHLGGNRYVDQWGHVYEETVGSSKDLEKAAAFMEQVKKVRIAEKISAEYGLSESRSMDLAQLHLQFRSIKNQRSLTKKDFELFSKEVLGVSTKVLKQAAKGEKPSYKKLIHQAALVNETSPENMRNLIQSIINQ